MMVRALDPRERQREALAAFEGFTVIVQMLGDKVELPAAELGAVLAVICESLGEAMLPDTGRLLANDDA